MTGLETNNNKKLVDVIHVGDYKTGSTWLQKAVFPQHPDIDYLGAPFKDKEVGKLIHQIINVRDLDFDANQTREAIEGHLKAISPDKKRVVSHEVLCGWPMHQLEHSRRTAERLRGVFGYVKVVFVIREQLSLVVSLYSQYIKIGGTPSLADFLLDPIGSVWLMERLKYHKAIAMYQEIFGKENVHIELYEALRQDSEGFLQRLFDFIGVSSHLPNLQERNKKLTTAGLFVQRTLNKLTRTNSNPGVALVPIDKIIWSIITAARKKKLNDLADTILPNYGEANARQRQLLALNKTICYANSRLAEKITIGGQLSLTGSQRELILSQVVDSNCILRDRFGIDIEKYGWCTQR